MSTRLLRSTPEAEGVRSEAIIAFVKGIEEAGIEFHHLTVARHGKVIAQGSWSPYEITDPHMGHSLTKVFTNTAVGMACDAGLFSLDDQVISFFPDELPEEMNENIRLLTVRDLITKRSGHGRGISGNEWRPIKTSWIAQFFKEPFVFKPGTEMRYTSATSYVLSAIIQKTSGLTMHEYMRRNLFIPMGIDDERWDLSPQGVNSGGNGLTIRNEDVIKLGLLYLGNGVYEGKRYLSEAWVEEAMEDIPERRGPKSSYGFHIIHEDGLYSSGGYFGQTLVMDRIHDMVFAFNGGLLDNAPNGIDERTRAILKATILADLGDDPLPEDPAAQEELRKVLSTRRLDLPAGSPHSRKEAHYAGRYEAKENEDGIKAFTFDFEDDRCMVTIEDARGTHQILCGLGGWIVSESSMTGNYLHHQYQDDASKVAAIGAWTTPNLFVMRWCWKEMTFVDTVVCLFKENKVFFKRFVNVNTQSLERPEIAGRHTVNEDARMRLYKMETQY